MLDYFSIFGLSFLIVGAVFLLIVFFTAGLIVWGWYTNKIFLPNAILFLMSTFEWPVKKLLWKINLDEVIINISNKVYHRAFFSVPFDKRAIFLPHCLRWVKCKAKTGFRGVECFNCGQCGLGKLVADAKKVGTPLHIVPGGSFMKRIIKETKPLAILGIACYNDAKQTMNMAMSKGLIPQLVVLSRDGCINTQVDYDYVSEIIKTINPD